MQSQMTTAGHYVSRAGPQLPDQQAPNVMSGPHRSNGTGPGVINSKDNRHGGHPQNSLHHNENHQRGGPKHVSFMM